MTLDLFPFETGETQVHSDSSFDSAGSEYQGLSIKRESRRLEERLIRAALQQTNGNRTHAAKILEISPRALQYKLKEYGIGPLNSDSRVSDSE